MTLYHPHSVSLILIWCSQFHKIWFKNFPPSTLLHSPFTGFNSISLFDINSILPYIKHLQAVAHNMYIYYRVTLSQTELKEDDYPQGFVGFKYGCWGFLSRLVVLYYLYILKKWSEKRNLVFYNTNNVPLPSKYNFSFLVYLFIMAVFCWWCPLSSLIFII